MAATLNDRGIPGWTGWRWRAFVEVPKVSQNKYEIRQQAARVWLGRRRFWRWSRNQLHPLPGDGAAGGSPEMLDIDEGDQKFLTVLNRNPRFDQTHTIDIGSIYR